MTKNVFDRRIASNLVLLDGTLLGRYAVELTGNKVVDYYPLLRELAFTEWLEVPIHMYTDDDGVVRIKV